MYTLIIAIHVVACFLLIAAILLQSGRGGGLSGLFGAGGASQTIFGARAPTFLTRATTTAAVVFLLTCITLTIFSSQAKKSLLEGAKIATEEAQTKAVFPAIPEETKEKPAEETKKTTSEEIKEEKAGASEEEPQLPQE